MKLSDLKPSITNLPPNEGLKLVLSIRNLRRKVKKKKVDPKLLEKLIGNLSKLPPSELANVRSLLKDDLK